MCPRRAQARKFALRTTAGFVRIVSSDYLWKMRLKNHGKKVQKIGTVSAMGFSKNARFNRLQVDGLAGSGELTR